MAFRRLVKKKSFSIPAVTQLIMIFTLHVYEEKIGKEAIQRFFFFFIAANQSTSNDLIFNSLSFLSDDPSLQSNHIYFNITTATVP